MGCPKCEKEKRARLFADNDDLAEHHTHERDKWECQRCRDAAAGVSLFTYLKANTRTRWDGANLVTFCVYCRAWARFNPGESQQFMIKRLGMARHNELLAKHKIPFVPTIENLQRTNDKLQRGFICPIC